MALSPDKKSHIDNNLVLELFYFFERRFLNEDMSSIFIQANKVENVSEFILNTSLRNNNKSLQLDG